MKNIFLLAVAVLFLATLVSCSQAEPEKISISVKEPVARAPVEARIVVTSKDKGREYRIDPEQEFTIDHQITNSGPGDRVVELVLTIVMDFHGAITWEVRPYSAEAKYQFVPNPQGPAHLFLQEGGTYHIIVVLTFPEGYRGTSVSVFLNVNDTNCTEIEKCPWG